MSYDYEKNAIVFGHVGHKTMKKSCLRSIFSTNGQILTKLAQIHHLENFKNKLDLVIMTLFSRSPGSCDSVKKLCTL